MAGEVDENKGSMGFSTGSYPDGSLALRIWLNKPDGSKGDQVEIIAGCKDSPAGIIVRGGEDGAPLDKWWGSTMGFVPFFDMVKLTLVDLSKKHCSCCGEPLDNKRAIQ